MSDSMKLTKAAPVGVANYDEELAKLYRQQGAMDGTENIGKDDVALPFLKILQGLSPEVTRGNEKYIKGAVAGQFINSLTGELFDGEKGVEIIRVHFSKKWIEWRPRKAGGGLVRISQSEVEAKQHKLPDTGDKDVDTYVNETAEIYALVKGEFGWQPVVFSASRTKLPFVRKWNTVIMSQRFGEFKGDETAAKLPPMATPKPYGVVFTLVTATKTNDSGTFFIPQLAPAKRLAAMAELKLAMEFYETIKAGSVKVEYTQPEQAEGGEADAVPGAGAEAYA